MSDTITAQPINCKLRTRNNNSRPTRDPTYWARRREWWRAEAKRQGVDWQGVIETQIQVADYLAGLRKRGFES
jgi:hypothetical protein